MTIICYIANKNKKWSGNMRLERLSGACQSHDLFPYAVKVHKGCNNHWRTHNDHLKL